MPDIGIDYLAWRQFIGDIVTLVLVAISVVIVIVGFWRNL